VKSVSLGMARSNRLGGQGGIYKAVYVSLFKNGHLEVADLAAVVTFFPRSRAQHRTHPMSVPES
jgi:hypothetical protein